MIERYLPTVFDVPTRVSFEVVFVDNLGTDGAASWVERQYSTVRVFRNTVAQSFAANINRCLERSRPVRYVAVWNPDIRCLPGLLDRLVAFMDANPRVGIAGPKLLNPDGSVQSSCRRFSTPLVSLLRAARPEAMGLSVKAINRYLMADFDHDSVADVDWVTGALMVVRTEAIREVGGMDERYAPAYGEDQDWCCRMWRAGWRVCYVPQALAVHDHQREGIRRPFGALGRAQYLNTLRMFRKFGWMLSRQTEKAA
jgi:hypothetical protein